MHLVNLTVLVGQIYIPVWVDLKQWSDVLALPRVYNLHSSMGGFETVKALTGADIAFKESINNLNDLIISEYPAGTFPNYTITVYGLDIPTFCNIVKSTCGESIGEEMSDIPIDKNPIDKLANSEFSVSESKLHKMNIMTSINLHEKN